MKEKSGFNTGRIWAILNGQKRYIPRIDNSYIEKREPIVEEIPQKKVSPMVTYEKIKEFPSKSNPSKSYWVSKRNDGVLTCNCPAWANNTSGDRTCRHTLTVALEFAKMGKEVSGTSDINVVTSPGNGGAGGMGTVVINKTDGEDTFNGELKRKIRI